MKGAAPPVLVAVAVPLLAVQVDGVVVAAVVKPVEAATVPLAVAVQPPVPITITV